MKLKAGLWQDGKLRFIVLLSILLVGGFLTTSLISYYVARESISSQIEKTALPLTSDNIYSEIQQDLLRPVFISSLMAQDTFVRDWAIGGERDEQAIIRYLKEIQDQYGTVTSFFVSEKTKRYYHADGLLKTVKQQDPVDRWYFEARKMRKDYEVNVDANAAENNSLTVFINHRVQGYSGELLGVIGVGLAVNVVMKLIDTYENRYGRQVFFMDREGRITLQGDDYNGRKSIRDIPGLSAYTTQILTSPSYSIRYENDSGIAYVNTRLVPEFDWYLVVEQDGTPEGSRIQNTLMGNLAISLVLSVVILFLAYLTIAGYQHRLEQMASTDKLTGVSNRQVFDVLFDQLHKLSKRRGDDLAAIMLDLDYFKQVNDQYGHPAGDAVLKSLVATVQLHIRESDILFRWGGEEFFILLPDCDLEQARQMAEKIRAAVELAPVHYGEQEIPVTASFGVALHLQGQSLAELQMRIDKALYQAKEQGRNRVIVAE